MIKPFEEHTDFESLVLKLKHYYLKDKLGKVKTSSKGVKLVNPDWEKLSHGFINPLYVELLATVRPKGEMMVENGQERYTGYWVDFKCPKEVNLPQSIQLNYRYQTWPRPLLEA